eukprot:Filipodium_phascolosomae@DN2156_c0_g1_i1.p1
MITKQNQARAEISHLEKEARLVKRATENLKEALAKLKKERHQLRSRCKDALAECGITTGVQNFLEDSSDEDIADPEVAEKFYGSCGANEETQARELDCFGELDDLLGRSNRRRVNTSCAILNIKALPDRNKIIRRNDAANRLSPSSLGDGSVGANDDIAQSDSYSNHSMEVSTHETTTFSTEEFEDFFQSLVD